jgi:hypothetical protein
MGLPDIFNSFSAKDIFLAVLFCLISINVIHLFALFYLKIPQEFINFKNSKRFVVPASTIKNKSLVYFGIIIFVATVIPEFRTDYLQIRSFKSIGYLGSYTLGRDNLFNVFAESLFQIGIITLMIAFKNKKVAWKIIYYFAITKSVLLMLLVGNRSSQIVLIIALMLIKHRFIDPFKKKDYYKLILYMISFALLATFVAFIRKGVNGLNSQEFFYFLGKGNFILSFIGELGGTLITPILTIINVPSNLPSAYGLSYFYSIISLFPRSNLIIGDNAHYLSLATQLNNFTLYGGLGGSFLAELYYNFQWYSLVFSALMGVFLGKFTNLFFSKSIENNTFKLISTSFILIPLFQYIRGHFYDFTSEVKMLLYSLILLWLYRLLFVKKEN